MTPRAKRSAFRQALIDVYYKALGSQSYPHWKAIVLGDEARTEGKFHYFFLPDGTREERFNVIRALLAGDEIGTLLGEADYVIKLDDDDIISPVLLDTLKDFKGDLYFDRFHTFLDSSSGQLTQQERSWVASTCVHGKKHILAPWSGPGASPVGNLLYTDHSKAWHAYYADKKITAADPRHPVYLRVLSPTSITSGAESGPPQSIRDVSMEKYYSYLRGFGSWKPAAVHDFDLYFPMIAGAWNGFAGAPQQPLPKAQPAGLKEKAAALKRKFFGRKPHGG